MSGPKGIVIEDPAEVARRQNESHIALLFSEYASLMRSLKKELEKRKVYGPENQLISS